MTLHMYRGTFYEEYPEGWSEELAKELLRAQAKYTR